MFYSCDFDSIILILELKLNTVHAKNKISRSNHSVGRAETGTYTDRTENVTLPLFKEDLDNTTVCDSPGRYFHYTLLNDWQLLFVPLIKVRLHFFGVCYT